MAALPLTVQDLFRTLSNTNEGDAEDLEAALEVLQSNKINTVARLLKLTEGHWSRLGLPIGIEAILREEAVALTADCASMTIDAGVVEGIAPSQVRGFSAALAAMNSGSHDQRRERALVHTGVSGEGRGNHLEAAVRASSASAPALVLPRTQVLPEAALPHSMPDAASATARPSASLITFKAESLLPTAAGSIADGWQAFPLIVAFRRHFLGPVSEMETDGRSWSVQDLARATGCSFGSSALMIRACASLGLFDYQSSTHTYSSSSEAQLVRAALDEVFGGDGLGSVDRGFIASTRSDAATDIRTGMTAEQALLDLYSFQLPFKIPSPEARRCLAVWSQLRGAWHRPSQDCSGSCETITAKLRRFAALLDGVVLLPVLVSVALLGTSNNTITETAPAASSRSRGTQMPVLPPLMELDFRALSFDERDALEAMLEETLALGSMDASGVFFMSPAGAHAMSTCSRTLFQAAAKAKALWSFDASLRGIGATKESHGGTGQETETAHVDGGSYQSLDSEMDARLCEVVADLEHCAFQEELIEVAISVFSGFDFAKQPTSVVVVDCGEGRLMHAIYQRIKDSTPRGTRLSSHPVQMVGVAASADAQRRCKEALVAAGIPHEVVLGNTGRPSQVLTALSDVSALLSGALFVLGPAARRIDRCLEPEASSKALRIHGGAFMAFLEEQLVDLTPLDSSGSRVTVCSIAASLVMHFTEWSEALLQCASPYGLCRVDTGALGLLTSRHADESGPVGTLDVIESLPSRSVHSPVSAIALAAAMAGFLPDDLRTVRCQPRGRRFCRLMAQRLVRRPFEVRLAEPNDMARLLELEVMAHGNSHSRIPEDALRIHMETSPTMNLVATLNGEVVAALYMQRIEDEADLDWATSSTFIAAQSPTGQLLQMISVIKDPLVIGLGLGAELRALAMHFARLGFGCSAGYAGNASKVTSAQGFKSISSKSMHEYIQEHVAGVLCDITIGFHTGFGAIVQRLCPGWWPKEGGSSGIGVLVRYDTLDIDSIGRNSVTSAISPSKRNMSCGQSGSDKTSGLRLLPQERMKQLLLDVFMEFGYRIDGHDFLRGFFDYGIDSIVVGQIEERIGKSMGVNVPPLLLYEHPTIFELSEHLLSACLLYGEGGEEAEFGRWDIRLDWSRLGVKELAAIQAEYLKAFKEICFQEKLRRVAAMCHPDKFMYNQAIAELCDEAQAKVLYRFGLLSNLSRDSIADANTRFQSRICALWLEAPELRKLSEDLIEATFSGSSWPTLACNIAIEG